MSVRKLHFLTALSLGAVLAGTGCGSKKPANLLPKQATPPPPVIAQQTPTPAHEAKPAVVEPAPEPKPDPVAELIAKVDQEYQAGQENLQSGNKDLAKQSFDRAFNLLMDSKLDPHSDPRLQQEYDKVLAGVNNIELQALQTDTPPPQKSEPAPIDEANEAATSVDPNVKAKAEAELKATHSDLPLMLTDPVAGYINYFSNHGRGVLERALARGGRYQDMMQRVLKQEGVPQDLIYLAQAESGFHPLAVSRAGARGIWQFMSMRARGYGLVRNTWIDERQDPEKSTRAAARHLKDLYNQFGDWYLAMAAYNSGPGTVQQAVKRTGYADFWELYKRNVLPRETRNYVPIIVAMTIMAKNPEQYGLTDVNRDDPVPYDTVKIDYPVDMRLVAQCLDVPVSTVQDLNPALLRWTTPKDGSFDLRIPEGTKETYLTAISAVPKDMRVWWRYHNIVAGDTLSSVARAYRTTPQAIAKANDLEDVAALEPGKKLVIPIAPGKHAASEDGFTYSRFITRYKVRKSDTVQTVADAFGVPPTMVRRWNHLKGDSVRGRRVLYIHLPVQPGTPGALVANVSKPQRSTSKSKSPNNLAVSGKSTVVHHKVQPGETLFSIATAYNTTVSAIKRDNRIVDVAALRPGTILIVHDGH